MTDPIAIELVEPIGTKPVLGHIAHADGHYWGEVEVPAYPRSEGGERLRDLRVSLELGLRDLANALGLDVVMASRLEYGAARCDWLEAERRLRSYRGAP